MSSTDKYRTIEGNARGVYRDRGSKFLAFAFPVRSAAEVRAILGDLRKEYHDARHHCYAYRLGSEKRVTRSSDDGEPPGSAGKPVLGQIRAFDLSNVLIVVVRYFGGTLLGAAYGAIAGAQTVPQVFVNGTRIGGLEDLERWAKKAA